MSEALDSASVPAGSRFTLTVTGGGTGADGFVDNAVFEHGAADAVRGRDECANGHLGVLGARHQFHSRTPPATCSPTSAARRVTNNTGVSPTVSFSHEDGKAYSSNSASVVITFSTLVYSNNSLTAFTTGTAAGIVTLKEDNSSGDSITFSVSSVGVDSSKTKTTFTITTNEGGTGLFADGTKFVSVSNAFYNDTGNQGTAGERDLRYRYCRPERHRGAKRLLRGGGDDQRGHRSAQSPATTCTCAWSSTK